MASNTSHADWQTLIAACSRTCSNNTRYTILKQLLSSSSSTFKSECLPSELSMTLVALLNKQHSPAVWLGTCVLICKLCRESSTLKEQLIRQDVVSAISSILDLSTVSFGSRLLQSPPFLSSLVECLTSLLACMSNGSSNFAQKLFSSTALPLMISLVDTYPLGLYGCKTTIAARVFQSLVNKPKLVGKCYTVPSSNVSSMYEYLFPTNEILEVDVVISSDPYVVDLYDTSTDEDIHIVEELVKQGGECSIWLSEDEMVRDDDSDTEWLDVRVTQVLNEAYFWAVLGTDDINKLDQIKQRLLTVKEWGKQASYMPDPGQMVCVVPLAGTVHRAWVIAAQGFECVQVFSLDYGFMETVSKAHLWTVDNDDMIMALPPLVHLCKLMGVKPLPGNKRIAENVLGTLCNVTSDRIIMYLVVSEKLRTEDIISHLSHLVTCPDTQLQTLVIRIYCNLARMPAVRPVIADHGILSSILDVIIVTTERLENPTYVTLMSSCLVLLQNLLLCDTVRKKFGRLQGMKTLMYLLSSSVPDVIRKCAAAAVRNFIGECSVELTSINLTEHTNLNFDWWTDDKKIGLKDICSDGRGSNLNVTSGCLNIGSNGWNNVSEECTYVLNEHVDLKIDNHCELRREQLEAVDRDCMCRLICGFLNSVAIGRIFFGFHPLHSSDRAIVRGVNVPQMKRDQLRLFFGKLASDFIRPHVTHETIRLQFHPVRNSDTRQNISDLYIIEIIIRKPPCMQPILYAASLRGCKPQVFIRRHGLMHVMQYKEIYESTVRETERIKMDRIAELQQEIDCLQAYRTLQKSNVKTL